MPASSGYALRQAYRRAGVRPPKPGLVRQPPPHARLAEREYAIRLERVIRAWHDRIETIGRGLTRSDSARADALDDELRAVFDMLVQAAGLEDWLGRTARGMANAQGAYTKRVLKIPPAGVNAQAAIEEFRRRNVRLITRMGADQAEKIAAILRPAQAEGRRWEEIAPEIEERIGVSESRARLIARDQTNKFNGEMQKAQQQGAGITEYVWSTSRDMAVRGRPGGVYEDSQENHWALEGKRFKWTEPPIIPGTSERAHPGERIQCRCVAIPVVPFFEDARPEPAGPAPAKAGPARLTKPIPADLTQGGLLPMRPESFGYLRGGGQPTEALPITVVNSADNTYVRDGRHRIALARERGERFVVGDLVEQGPRGGERRRHGVKIPI